MSPSIILVFHHYHSYFSAFVTATLLLLQFLIVFNPRHMRQRVTVVFLCVYVCVFLSVTKLAAIYLIYESKVRCYKVPYL